jgi:urate oxidase
MKNFIQRETMNFPGYDLESFCRFLATKFLQTYPQAEGIQVSASEVPYQGILDGGVAFAPAGPDRATARIEMQRAGAALTIVEISTGITGFRLLRLGGSAFHGFVRDEYTTLPDITNRPLHMWLDLDWSYTTPEAAFQDGAVIAAVRKMVYEVFQGFESGSIQQVIYQLGTRMLADIPELGEIRLEANNRTWDTVVESGQEVGVYTDPRPPYGCLGLTLRR